MIVPFTRLEDGVLEALDATGYPVELHDVSGSDFDYWRLLATLWKDTSSDLCIVEQDVVVRPDTLAKFDECLNPWCAGFYKYLGSDRYSGLG